MLTFFNGPSRRYCDGVSRRSFLKVGTLAMGGLALPEALRLQAQGAVSPSGRAKSVIMICLEGGPSHLDMYDLKPEAPAEFRGEFRPIHTKVPGMQICEHLPRQAKLADKFSIVRSVTWQEVEHQRMEIFTGYPTKDRRPAFGSCVSRMARGRDEMLPKFVSLSGRHRAVGEAEQPLYAGAQHRAFVPTEEGLKSFETNRQVDLSRLRSRKELLGALDTLRRDVDASGEMGALDAFTGQALDMVTGGRARKAFDLSEEKPEILDRYRAAGNRFACNGGYEFWDWEAFVRARRLVEAGVPFVSMEVGSWDNHGTIFKDLRVELPIYDLCLSALLTDLQERGLDKDVCVIVWGEFGRSPRVDGGGRGHHPGAGFALFAGGGLRMGQVVGATSARGEHPITRAYTPQNILATLYHVLGIDPSVTMIDHGGRPQYLLDDREPVAELI